VTWAGGTVIVVVVSFVSNRLLRGDAAGSLRNPTLLLDGLVQYDGHRYLSIAAHGYSYTPGVQSPIVWFPLYPILIRAAQALVGDPIPAAVAVTVVSAAIALSLYWRWLGDKGIEGPARLAAFGAFAVYPYSWFLYGVVYADATFLALAFAAVLLVERDRLALGALAGALATACRPTGLALVPALVLISLDRHGVLGPWSPAHGSTSRTRRAVGRLRDWLQVPSSLDRSRLRPRTLLPILSLGGLVAYAAYLWSRFGDPLIFITNESTFHPGIPILKLTFFSRLVHVTQTPVLTGTLTLQAAFAAATLASAGAVARRFGFPYGVLVLAAVALPVVGSHDFMGTGRYLLLAFPTFALVGERLSHAPRLVRVVLAGSAALMVLMAFGFSRSVYLS
jgi:hypothetical protein